MSTAIDAAQAPEEYVSGGDYDYTPKHNRTVTIEATEFQKLLRIAGAVYAYLHQGAPKSLLQDVCDDYSVFCGVISKPEIRRALTDEEIRLKDTAIMALHRLDKGIQKGLPWNEIKKLCDAVTAAYIGVMEMRKKK